ncbi:MAG: hypothetical protein M3N95_10800 [Actinomycetota bacterium]|nr:hypothetical protein [Actinomycetota bacterium]
MGVGLHHRTVFKNVNEHSGQTMIYVYMSAVCDASAVGHDWRDPTPDLALSLRPDIDPEAPPTALSQKDARELADGLHAALRMIAQEFPDICPVCGDHAALVGEVEGRPACYSCEVRAGMRLSTARRENLKTV